MAIDKKTWVQIVLVIGMLTTGSVNTLSKKMGYNKGGMCGASMPAERPMKKGK